MKIRCEKCYRVLNDNEVYCTRCGEFSQAINVKMQGQDQSSPTKHYITQLFLAFFVAFFLNGALIILFSVLFSRFFPDIPYGEMDERLPLSVTLFSHTNAILVTSIGLFGVIFVIYRKKLINIIGTLYRNEILYALWFGVFGLLLFLFLALKTPFSIIPSYYHSLFQDPSELIPFIGSLAYVKVFIGIMLYALIQEVIFRHALVAILDEVTLLPDVFVILIIGLSSALFDWFVFGFNMSMIIGNILLQLFLSTSFVFFRRHILFNLIFRTILIILLIIIL